MRNAIIVIIGSHGTGKTTLFQWLQEHLDLKSYGIAKLNLLPDIARECPYPVGATSTIESQEWIFNCQYQRESQASGITLADGCLIVDYAYQEYWVGKDQAKLEISLKAFQEYAIRILLPCDPHLCKPDGIRSGDIIYQAKIDKILRRLVTLSGCPVYKLPKVPNANRELYALDIITRWLDTALDKSLR